MRNDFLWVEKYSPKKIEDCILPESTKKTFQDFVLFKIRKQLLQFSEKTAIVVGFIYINCSYPQ